MYQLFVLLIKIIGVMMFAGRCISLQMYFLNKWASMLSNRKDKAMMIGSG